VLFPFQSRETFPWLLASADACLVPLDDALCAFSVPSKLYTVMAAARPVLALVNDSSEVARVVRQARCGAVLPPGRPDLLARTVKEWYRHPEQCAPMGRNARRYLDRHFNKGEICSRYEVRIQALARCSGANERRHGSCAQ
jgi:colanic acid biosynthesis glycosyl transferase WcaI